MDVSSLRILEIGDAPLFKRAFPENTLAVWTGNELTYIPTPDPADLPDLAAVPSGSSDSDDLFSAL